MMRWPVIIIVTHAVGKAKVFIVGKVVLQGFSVFALQPDDVIGWRHLPRDKADVEGHVGHEKHPGCPKVLTGDFKGPSVS